MRSAVYLCALCWAFSGCAFDRAALPPEATAGLGEADDDVGATDDASASGDSEKDAAGAADAAGAKAKGTATTPADDEPVVIDDPESGEPGDDGATPGDESDPGDGIDAMAGAAGGVAPDPAEADPAADDPADPGDELSPLPPARFAGACAGDSDCAPDESCIDAGTITYCAQACDANSQCEAPPDGSSPVCARMLNGGGVCRLACDFLVNENCPGDMVCQDALPFPVGTGTCGFAN